MSLSARSQILQGPSSSSHTIITRIASNPYRLFSRSWTTLSYLTPRTPSISPFRNAVSNLLVVNVPTYKHKHLPIKEQHLNWKNLPRRLEIVGAFLSEDHLCHQTCLETTYDTLVVKILPRLCLTWYQGLSQRQRSFVQGSLWFTDFYSSSIAFCYRFWSELFTVFYFHRAHHHHFGRIFKAPKRSPYPQWCYQRLFRSSELFFHVFVHGPFFLVTSIGESTSFSSVL